jgi:hypothetical protein
MRVKTFQTSGVATLPSRVAKSLRQLGEPRIVRCGNVLRLTLRLGQVQALQRLGENDATAKSPIVCSGLNQNNGPSLNDC